MRINLKSKKQDMQDNKVKMLHSELTESILGCCFDVMNEHGYIILPILLAILPILFIFNL